MAEKLLQLCAALDAGDFVTATHVQVRRRAAARAACQRLLRRPPQAASGRGTGACRSPAGPLLQVGLTTNDWDECSAWLTALKRLIKARQMLG